MTKSCIIVGASHAGAQLCISLRQGGWEGPIHLIGDEPDWPYHHPPLSKDFLSGEKSTDDILIRPVALYETNGISVHLNTRVNHIDREAKTISLSGGETMSYDKLVLATGARVRKLNIPGSDLPGIFYLRDTRDVRAIKANVGTAKRAVIIGGGYIGLETAASLRKQGLEVTVLEAMDRILQRVTAPIMSDFFRRVHTEEGVQIFENEMAAKIEQEGDGLVVHTTDGGTYAADLVIVGIGVTPNTELATTADLAVENGIVVNGYCQTNDANIYAAGDVTWHHNPMFDTHLRLESVPNATEQAKVVAHHINGTPKPYDALPWFWSDQFDVKLQIAGLFQGFDNIVVRGDAKQGRSFATFYFGGDQLLAVDAVNSPREFMFARSALMKGHRVDKAILADTEANLKTAIIDTPAA